MRTRLLALALLVVPVACGDDDAPTTSTSSSSSSSSTGGASSSSSSSSGSATAQGLICLDSGTPQWCKRYDPPPAGYRPSCAKEVTECPATKVVAKCTRAENPGGTVVLYDQDFYVLPETIKAQIKKQCEDAKGTFTETP